MMPVLTMPALSPASDPPLIERRTHDRSLYRTGATMPAGSAEYVKPDYSKTLNVPQPDVKNPDGLDTNESVHPAARQPRPA